MQKVALVTGGMGTLGTAICRRLHKDGFKVTAIYGPHETAPGGWLAAQQGDGFELAACRADVSDYADCERMMQQLLAEHGRVDVLVNHPAATRDRALAAMSADDWHAVLQADLDSVFNVTRHAIEPMLAQRWGRIINISSIDAQQGAPGRANAGAALGGMHGFTKALALEMAKSGVTVNTITPGHLRTAGGQDDGQAGTVARIPVGRLGEPGELAGLVAYLVSDVAQFVTGANIPINGGEHLF